MSELKKYAEIEDALNDILGDDTRKGALEFVAYLKDNYNLQKATENNCWQVA